MFKIKCVDAKKTEIRNDLREASLVLMPSKKEGFGLVGLEAIACGVPTLLSAQSGLAETLKKFAPDHAPGWILSTNGDPIAKWAERIESILLARKDSFSRAAALKNELAERIQWKTAAEELLNRLASLRPR